MRSFLSSNQDLDEMELFNNKSDLGQLFKSCSIMEHYDEGTGTEHWNNIAFEMVTNHFLKKEKKYSIDELRRARDDMFSIEYDKSVEGTDYEDDYYFNQNEMRYEKMISYFGSNYGQKLEEFIINRALTHPKIQEETNQDNAKNSNKSHVTSKQESNTPKKPKKKKRHKK